MSLTRFEFTNRVRPIMEVGIGSSVIDESAALWDVSLWDAPTSTWNGDEPLWRDVSCDVIDAHIELGRGRITDAFPVGTANVTVDNNSGWADPSIDQEDSTVGHLSFPGTAGNYVSVDDYTALAIPGDQCFMFRFRTSDWPPPYVTGVIATQNLAWAILIEPSGALELWVVSGGVLTIMTSDPITPSTDWRWYAITLDANNGAGGHDWKVWYGGSDDDPAAWVEFDSRTAAGVLTIDNTTQPLILGTTVDDGFYGDISHFSYRNGTGPSNTVGGTTVFEFNGWDLRDEDVDSSSIMPRVGPNPMIINGDVGVVAAIQPDAAHLRLRPGRAIRIGVVHDTLGTHWLYRGFIDAIQPKDDAADWSTVTMECIDALGEAGRAKLAAEVESGAGEQARTRFGRILDLIRWPTTKRAISTSAIRPLYAAELDGQVVDLLRQTAESEGGWAFADTNGDVVLQHRDWLYHVVGDPTDATIGNLTGAALELLLENGLDLLLEQSDEILLELSGSDVCPTRWVRAFDRRDITTRVILDRDWPSTVETPGPPIVADDAAAQVLYGIEPFERLDLWTMNTSNVQENAGRILATRAARVSMPRVRSVTVDAAAGADADKRDAAIDLLTELSIFTPSRYRGRFQTDRGVVFDSNFFAVGVTHDLSAEGWSADISLDRSFPFEVLDPADYIWDTARWDRSLWN